jgi:hypothetical protein
LRALETMLETTPTITMTTHRIAPISRIRYFAGAPGGADGGCG